MLDAPDSAPELAIEIREACQNTGFFYVIGHGVSQELMTRLEKLSEEFFAQTIEIKRKIHMSLGGLAWRGYFSVGEELTSGTVDQKEGLYFGAEHSPNHPKVLRGTPLHGANLFPDIVDFRKTVLEYMKAMTNLGHRLMRGIALSLKLDPEYFRNQYRDEPTILFRIFNYPGFQSSETQSHWGVGEHTDYGILTILKQDCSGGLQVKTGQTWLAVPAIPGSFVINLGDMLERMTNGLYRSTPHRVQNQKNSRLSWPFFFDPHFDAKVQTVIPKTTGTELESESWDGCNVHKFQGSYGEYLLSKVKKVFPKLGENVLPRPR